jgi:hypothetical protein
MASTTVPRTSVQLYRDCLRLIRHVAPGKSSSKAMALRTTVRTEFDRHRDLHDEERLEAAKANAVRALSNYMLAVAAPKDPKLKARMQDFHGRSVREAKAEPRRQLSPNSTLEQDAASGTRR